LPFFHNDAWANLGIFVVMQIVFIPTIGGSIGHRLLGLRLVALKGGWIGLWRPVVRTLLLALVVPALVWDSDQRGFHDKIAGTVLLRL
ncbi:MAG TPA: RDD family protein, partial [Diaminobutyricibacter sp.]